MRIITLKMIMDAIKSYSSMNRGLAIFFIVIIILILACITAVSPVIAVLGFFLLPLFAFAAFKILKDSCRTRKSLKKRDFYIISSTCSEKTITYNADGEVYNLTFQNGAKIVMNIENTVFFDDSEGKTLCRAYNKLLVGDSFYLVYENNNDIPILIIPKKQCRLDMRGFWNDGGIIRPVKSK